MLSPEPRSPAAERMRRYRKRRRRGERCLIVRINETEIDALIEKGFLVGARHDSDAVLGAVYDALSHVLDEPA